MKLSYGFRTCPPPNTLGAPSPPTRVAQRPTGSMAVKALGDLEQQGQCHCWAGTWLLSYREEWAVLEQSWERSQRDFTESLRLEISRIIEPNL